MTASLLDVNVLIGLLWSDHPHHRAAQKWFSANADSGWATCAFTQTSFVRIVSNPVFSEDSPSPDEAAELLEEFLLHPAHEFWNCNLSFAQALQPFHERFSGHLQATDIYLLALAMHHHSRLITFDSRIASLLPDEKSRSRHVVTLPAN
jgi:uncharacterized protein